MMMKIDRQSRSLRICTVVIASVIVFLALFQNSDTRQQPPGLSAPTKVHEFHETPKAPEPSNEGHDVAGQSPPEERDRHDDNTTPAKKHEASSTKDDQAGGRVSCGPSGSAASCSACPMDYGEVQSAGCQGSCHWCEYGTLDDPPTHVFDKDANHCFPVKEPCYEPRMKHIIDGLARVATPWQGEPLGFCMTSKGHKEEDPSGILLAKTFKTGSTSAAAVTIHIADRVAKRKKPGTPRCRNEYHHGFSRKNQAKLRVDPSVLWTSVREPGSRAISAYYYFVIGHRDIEAKDDATIKFLQGVKNHQLVQLRTQREGQSAGGGKPTEPSQQITRNSNQLYARILREEVMPLYDFIAVTERWDESLVVLKMLWGLKTGDIIVSASKTGAYSYNWDPPNTCFKIRRTERTPAVEKYIANDFRRKNGDFLLHAVANRSLDMTIDYLGRDKFNREFEEYKKLKAFATSICLHNATFPCSPTGAWQPEFVDDCYNMDIGCGYRCIDDVLDRYESGELTLPTGSGV